MSTPPHHEHRSGGGNGNPDRGGVPERPSGFIRWLDRTRGWPRDVPIESSLRRRMAREQSRVSVHADLDERLTRSGLARPGATVLWLLVVAIVPQSHFVVSEFFDDVPAVIVLWLVVILAVEWVGLTRILNQVTGPRVRAALRREGIDCCVRCGHLMGAGGVAASCPECGLDHAFLPLRWGPAPLWMNRPDDAVHAAAAADDETDADADADQAERP